MLILKYSLVVRVLALSSEGLSLSISNAHKISFYSQMFPITIIKNLLTTYITITLERVLMPYFILCKCLICVGTGALLSHPLEPVLVPPGLWLAHLDPPGYPALHRVDIRGVLIRVGTEKHHTVHFIMLVGDVKRGVVFFICWKFMHGPLISKVWEVVLHCILYLRWEGGVVVIGARTDATLVKHSVKRDFVHTFLKYRFRWSHTIALVKRGWYILFAVLNLGAQGSCTFPDTVSVFLDHCKLVTKCSEMLLLFGLFMRIDGMLWLQMCEYPPISRSMFKFVLFLVIFRLKMHFERYITRFIKYRVLVWLIDLSYRVALPQRLQDMIGLAEGLKDLAGAAKWFFKALFEWLLRGGRHTPHLEGSVVSQVVTPRGLLLAQVINGTLPCW